ncbi:GNAT family N-acetyltransferase [Modestobacter sp. URMC 112]
MSQDDGEHALVPRDLVLSTPRLVLRATTAADAPRMTEIQSDWAVTRWLRLASWPPSLDAMSAWAATHEDEWLAGAAYRFAVVHADQLVGVVDVDGIDHGDPSLGYWFDPAHWGRGLGREAAAAVVDFAFSRLALDHLVAGHDADNDASGRILHGLGFRHVEDGVRWSGPWQADRGYRSYRLERAWTQLPAAR